MTKLPETDIAIIELLRKHKSMSIAAFVDELQVTATAIRQRLNRLLGKGLIDRQRVAVEGRGRPGHVYSLTESGMRQSGANFADLALVLWNEIRSIEHPEVRKGLLKRISASLAEKYKSFVDSDEDVETKMRSVVELLKDRDVPFEVDSSGPGELPVLNAMACPYPDLAENDRSVCSMEKMLFSELIGENLKLTQCRLDGGACCSFEVN